MTHPINIRAEYWAVEVPEETTGYRIEYIPEIDICELILYKVSTDPDFFYELDEFKNIDLPLGHWQIICLSGECTEEQAKDIVENDGEGYKDYDADNFHHDIPFANARQSLDSLLRSKSLNAPNYIILKKKS